MYLSEMIIERPNAISKCMKLGNEFIEHFSNIAEEGPYSKNFAYHYKELVLLWNSVKSIRLKDSGKIISNFQLIDWFFSMGTSIELIISSKYQNVYEEFCIKLLNNKDKTIMNVLYELEIECKEKYKNKWLQ